MQMRDNQNSIRETVSSTVSWLESTCRGLISRRHENLFVSGQRDREGKKRFPSRRFSACRGSGRKGKRARTLDLFEYTSSLEKRVAYTPCLEGVCGKGGRIP